MTVTAGDALLFVFGLIPQYVSVILVEKHYTNFWTGFWNIYGLIQVVASLVLSTGDVTLVVLGILVILILLLVLWLSTQPDLAGIARSFGASLTTTSVSWGMLSWFLSANFYVGVLVGLLHAIGLYLLRDRYRKAKGRS